MQLLHGKSTGLPLHLVYMKGLKRGTRYQPAALATFAFMYTHRDTTYLLISNKTCSQLIAGELFQFLNIYQMCVLRAVVITTASANFILILCISETVNLKCCQLSSVLAQDGRPFNANVVTFHSTSQLCSVLPQLLTLMQ